MARLVTILKKQLWEQWVGLDWLDNPLSVFTEEEYTKIVAPYLSFVRALPGIQADQIQTFQNQNEFVTVRVFDTVEHAQNAMNKLSDNTDEQIVRNMLILIKAKQSTNGNQYQREMKIIA